MVGVRERRWAWIACILAITAMAALAVSPLADALRDTPGKTYRKKKPRRFVPIPDRVPHTEGAYIDRRIKRNLVWISRHFDIYVTEGFAGRLPSGRKVGCPQCHVKNSEHKIGLAVDIVPLRWSSRCDKRWRPVTKLAKWAEPHQNEPLPPFRWVGYNKDEAHGCGHHLHLSWNHHERYRKFKPSRWAEVFKVRARDRDGSGGGGGTGGGGVSAAASTIQPPPPGELRQFEPEG